MTQEYMDKLHEQAVQIACGGFHDKLFLTEDEIYPIVEGLNVEGDGGVTAARKKGTYERDWRLIGGGVERSKQQRGMVGGAMQIGLFYVSLKTLDPNWQFINLIGAGNGGMQLPKSDDKTSDNYQIMGIIKKKAKDIGLTHTSPVSPACTDPNSEYYVAPASDPNKNNTNAIGTRKRNYFKIK